MYSEKTLWQWHHIAFKRAAKGLPALDLSRLAADDKRRIYYVVGQLRGERAMPESLRKSLNAQLAQYVKARGEA